MNARPCIADNLPHRYVNFSCERCGEVDTRGLEPPPPLPRKSYEKKVSTRLRSHGSRGSRDTWPVIKARKEEKWLAL